MNVHEMQSEMEDLLIRARMLGFPDEIFEREVAKARELGQSLPRPTDATVIDELRRWLQEASRG
jgi:hypothetical protein